MSSVIWAIVERKGGFVIRHTDGAHPEYAGCKKECKGRAVHQLAREPEAHERVDFETGAIVPCADRQRVMDDRALLHHWLTPEGQLRAALGLISDDDRARLITVLTQIGTANG